jgi:biopolymer transport protein ExbD
MIAEVHFRGCEMRITVLVAGLALLVSVLSACAEDPAPEPPKSPAVVEEATTPGWAPPASLGIELARIGSYGEAPDPEDALVVDVAPDGRIEVAGEALDLDSLLTALQKRADERRDDEGMRLSELDVVLRLDRRLPWCAAQWLMQHCAHPEVFAWKIHFAVLPEKGEEVGVLPAFLPRDRGIPRSPSGFQERVQVDTSIHLQREGVATDPAALHGRVAELTRIDASLRANVTADRLVPLGYVLRVVDVLWRSGVKGVTFTGTPPPRGPDAIEKLVDEAREAGGVPAIRLFDRPVRGEPDGPLPPGVRVRPPTGDTLSAARTVEEIPVIEEDLRPIEAYEVRPIEDEVRPIEEEMPAEVPIEDESSTMRDTPVDEPRVPTDDADETFEGPSGGAVIGPGGGAGEAFGGRKARREPEGGTRGELTLPVVRGLFWLARNQRADGAWSAGEEARFRPGVTGLALLAFLRTGHTHRSGQHTKAVREGLRFLLSIQDPEGCFGPRSDGTFVYDHALATNAMIEAYAMTGSPLFRESAKRAIASIERCRNPYFAWRYGIRPQDNDTSVTTWMVMALATARDAELQAPVEAFEGAASWLEKVTEPEMGFVGYTARGTGPSRPGGRHLTFPADRSRSTTAMGIYTRMLLGQDPEKNEMIRKGVALCRERPPRWERGSVDLVYWLFGTRALRRAGGEAWRTWDPALRKAVLEHQRREDGELLGSWDPVGMWGQEGGRVYATAMAVLCLEAAGKR